MRTSRRGSAWRWLWVVPAVGLAILLMIAARPLKAVLTNSEPLTIKWEGAVIDMNFRDVGASLNACLGERRFTEGVAFRAAGWFSGWSCAKVGNPDVILSLSHDPKKENYSFCSKDDGSLVIGQAFNPTWRLNDLEFLPTWQDPVVRKNTCGFFLQGFRAIAAGKRTLFHCEAGRDRTGTYAALLAGLVAEERGMLDDRMLAAIECDYHKSRSLAPKKYGRMRRLLLALKAQGGVAQFFERTCEIPPALLLAVADRMSPAEASVPVSGK